MELCFGSSSKQTQLVSENVFLHRGQIQRPWSKTEAICLHNSVWKPNKLQMSTWKQFRIALNAAFHCIWFLQDTLKTRFFYLSLGDRWPGEDGGNSSRCFSDQKYLRCLLSCYMTTCYPGSVVLNTFSSGHLPSPGSSPEALIQLVLARGMVGHGKGQEAKWLGFSFLKLPRQS